MSKKSKKSPLKYAPLRYPGQSIDDEINALWDEKIALYILYIAGFFGLAIADWIRWLNKTPIKPTQTTIVFLIVLTICIYKINRTKSKIIQLKMARDGEKIVGQYLDELREDGARILHDLQGENFNVDHVIFSEHGLFTVETKTYRKPMRGDARVRVENDKVYVDNYLVERNPIEQSRAQARWVQSVLEESTGKKFPVQGVVVFPGWYVEKMSGKEDVWVLNHKALPVFIRNSPSKLCKEDVHMAFFHLASYARLKG